MAEPKPRNWKAMREDRVLAMAENRFGKRFATKAEAIAALSGLSPREQRSLKKVAVSKAERARRSQASERMISGMSGREPSKMASIDDSTEHRAAVENAGTSGLRTPRNSNPGLLEDLTSKYKAAAASGKAMDMHAVQDAVAAAKLSKTDAHALAKAVGAPIRPYDSGPRVQKRLTSWLFQEAMELSRQSRIARIAPVAALTVGVAAAAATSIFGSSSAEAATTKKRRTGASGPSKNEVAKSQADAQAKAAEAEAAKANAEARRLELQAQKDAADRADARRAEDRSAGEQLRQIGLIAAPLAAGVAYGVKKANQIEAKAEKGLRARNTQLAKVANKVRGSTDPARLRAGVRVADKMGLMKKAPLGGISAAFLAGEAVAARVIAANTENETASATLNGAAVGLGAAAVTQVGTRMVQRATSAVQPNAAAMVDVETARETLKRGGRAVAKATPKGGAGVLAKATKIALPVLAGVAAYSAYTDAASAGESSGEATTKAAKAAGDVVSMGAISAYDEAKARGAGEAEAVAKGAAMGVINYATMGVVEAANDALASQGGFAGYIDKAVKMAGEVLFGGKAEAAEAPKGNGKPAGWSDAAREASAEARGVAKPGEAKADTAPIGRGAEGTPVDRVAQGVGGVGGMVLGKAILNEARGSGMGIVGLGARGVGAAAIALGGVMVADAVFGGKADAAEAKATPAAAGGPGAGIGTAAAVTAAGAGAVTGSVIGLEALRKSGTLAKGGLVTNSKAGALVLAGALGIGAAKAGIEMIKASAGGLAFLNPEAEKKAQQPEKAPVSHVVAHSANAERRSDGETNAYTRRGRNGQTVRVKAYRTPNRR